MMKKLPKYIVPTGCKPCFLLSDCKIVNEYAYATGRLYYLCEVAADGICRGQASRNDMLEAKSFPTTELP